MVMAGERRRQAAAPSPDRAATRTQQDHDTSSGDISVTGDTNGDTGDRGRVDLLAHHNDLLKARGLTDPVILARGYSSTHLSKWLHERMGLSLSASKQVPGLVIPIRDVRGEPAFICYRPDNPREGDDGRPIKYEMPTSARNKKVGQVLDAPLLTRHNLDDPAVPLWVTEGPIKADAICSAGGTAVGTFGVWGWKGRGKKGGSMMRPDWDEIVLKGRLVYLVPDSDVTSNSDVAKAVSRLGLALDSRGADVRYCWIPATADGRKQGVDDYLARGGTLDGLQETATEDPPAGSRAPGTDPAVGLWKGADNRFTDAKLAETVAAEVLADRFMWVEGMDWLAWDGRRWDDACTEVTVAEAVRAWSLERFMAAVQLVQGGKGDIGDLDGWRGLLEAPKQARVLKLARGIVERHVDELDPGRDVLNTPVGVVDLRTGDIQEPAPALLMTKITRGSWRPGYRHPDWDKALTALHEPERWWLQTRVGQGVTGRPPPDDRMLVTQGGGDNGKSAITSHGLVPALGDYASMASIKLIQAAKGKEHSTEIADMRGRHLVIAEELTEHRAINVGMLKQLTGTGRNRARLLYQNNMEFQASHTIICTTNYVPRVEETDHGTWRRLVLLRFPFRFVKKHEPLLTPMDRRGDAQLRDRIEEGADGQHDAIVTWAVEGAMRFYADPEGFAELTPRLEADHRAWQMEADRILGYWSEVLIPDRDAMVVKSEALDDFNRWLRNNGTTSGPRSCSAPGSSTMRRPPSTASPRPGRAAGTGSAARPGSTSGSCPRRSSCSAACASAPTWTHPCKPMTSRNDPTCRPCRPESYFPLVRVHSWKFVFS